MVVVSVQFFFLGEFGGFGDAADEADEAVAVAFGWDGGDLFFVVGEGFPEVFEAFYCAVLSTPINICTPKVGEERARRSIRRLTCVKQSIIPR